MPNPQQPEIGRSRRTPAQDPDSAATVIEGTPHLTETGPDGPIPPENQPGHHPPHEQDKPDLDAFAERLGTVPGSSASGESGAPSPAGTGEAPAAGTSWRAVDRSTVRRAAAALVAVLAVLFLGRTVRRRVVSS